MKHIYSIALLLLTMLTCFFFSSCTKSTLESSTPKTALTEESSPSPLQTPPLSDTNNTTISSPTPTPTPEMEYMPIIRINTVNEASIPTDKQTVDCTINLECSIEKYQKSDLNATIRVRGNGSLSVAHQIGKYPYKIKFENKINPFGLGEAKANDWCLLANTCDRTMLRNYAAKRLGDMLPGIPFSSNSMSVRVYLNNSYMGVYELTEQVEVGNKRVDIDDSHTGEENGFLVELDYYAWGGDENDVFFAVGENSYTVKSDINNPKQIEYIKKYLEKVERAIFYGNKAQIEKLVDMDSLVDMYLLQEFIKNTDTGYSSFFMSKEIDGKLFFTAPWDFDLSAGNDERVDNGDYKYIYVGEGRDGYIQNHIWYIKLYSFDWFKKMVKQRWAEISDTIIVDLINEVKQEAEENSSYLTSNFMRWCYPTKKIHCEPHSVYSLKNANEHIDFLIEWMNNRKIWLDQHWLGE